MKKIIVVLVLSGILLTGLAIAVRAASSTSVVETQISPPEKIFQELNNKALASVKGGWLYVKEYLTHDVDPLPDIEGLIPLQDTVTEIWYYINSNGMVEKFVTIEKTVNGEITQIAVFSDGTVWNSSVDEIVTQESFLFEGLHYGLPSQLKSPDIEVNTVVNGDLNVTEFSISIPENEPIDMLDYDKALLSMGHYYIFDSLTGFLKTKKTIAYLEDGSQRELDFIQVEVKIGAAPPSEVLKYFEIKKDRENQK
jgi:hypothetical protein